MSTNGTNSVPPAEIPQPAPTLTPQAVLEQLRALRSQIGEVTPLTLAQRNALRRQSRASAPVLQASIDVIGALPNVSQAVGQPADQVRQLEEETNRWATVEGELRAMLKGVAGANLIRRQRVRLIAAQAAVIGAQLARDPAHAILIPHVEEVRRLKIVARRKKPAPAAATPPNPPSGQKP